MSGQTRSEATRHLTLSARLPFAMSAYQSARDLSPPPVLDAPPSYLDPVLPDPRQYSTYRVYYIALVFRVTLLSLCVFNFLYLVYVYVTTPARTEVIYEDRELLMFPSVMICPMVGEGNITRPYKAFISRRPGEDYDVDESRIQQFDYFPRGHPGKSINCWTVDLSASPPVQSRLPGYRVHLHFDAHFPDEVPNKGIVYHFFEQTKGPYSANVTYGVVNYITYGDLQLTHDEGSQMWAFQGASIPVGDSPTHTILNVAPSLTVGLRKHVYELGLLTWIPLLFASFQYRLLYDLLFPEVDAPRRRIHPLLTPGQELKEWLYLPPGMQRHKQEHIPLLS